MTIKEAQLAIDGHLTAQGIKKKRGMSRNEFLDLKAGKVNVNSR